MSQLPLTPRVNETGKLWLSKIGEIKIKLHRAIVGEIQRLNIRRMPTGKWFVSFIVEVEPDEHLPKTELSIGVDVGLKSFITLSNGEHVDNPRFFVHEENALAKAQRKLSKAEKGTPERVNALKWFIRFMKESQTRETTLYKSYP